MHTIGAKVQLGDRKGEGDTVIPGRGLKRVGKVVKITRAVSGDGKREVENCHVLFPEHAHKGKKLPAVTEIHEAGALVAVEE